MPTLAIYEKKVFFYLMHTVLHIHPSQPNYIHLTAGDNISIIDDEAHYVNWYYINNTQHKLPPYTYQYPGYRPLSIIDLLENNKVS